MMLVYVAITQLLFDLAICCCRGTPANAVNLGRSQLFSVSGGCIGFLISKVTNCNPIVSVILSATSARLLLTLLVYLVSLSESVLLANSIGGYFSWRLEQNESPQQPPSLSVAVLLKNELSKKGYCVQDVENWCDCGWLFHCSEHLVSLTVVVAQAAQVTDWLVQISPQHTPGIIGRTFNKKSSASASDVLRLSRIIHEVLDRPDRASTLQWQWNDDLNVAASTAEP